MPRIDIPAGSEPGALSSLLSFFSSPVVVTPWMQRERIRMSRNRRGQEVTSVCRVADRWYGFFLSACRGVTCVVQVDRATFMDGDFFRTAALR